MKIRPTVISAIVLSIVVFLFLSHKTGRKRVMDEEVKMSEAVVSQVVGAQRARFQGGTPQTVRAPARVGQIRIRGIDEALPAEFETDWPRIQAYIASCDRELLDILGAGNDPEEERISRLSKREMAVRSGGLDRALNRWGTGSSGPVPGGHRAEAAKGRVKEAAQELANQIGSERSAKFLDWYEAQLEKPPKGQVVAGH